MAQQRKRIYCPHCDEYVARTVFYQHKQLYFDDTQQIYTDHDYPQQVGPIAFEFTPDMAEPVPEEVLVVHGGHADDFSSDFEHSDDDSKQSC